MKTQLWLLLCLLLCSNVITGQNFNKSGDNKEQRQQRQYTEQLAGKFYNEKDFEKAQELYLQLFEKYHQQHYFNQYIECLIRLKDYGKAEKMLKSFVKHNNSWKARVDLIYVYTLNNQISKAQKEFTKLIGELPTDKNLILLITNTLRSRDLNEQALVVFDESEKKSKNDYQYNIERAYTYHSMAIYDKAFEFYFKNLESDPSQYDVTKSRLQNMLIRDIDGNIAEEMRIALLKKSQEKPDNLQFAELLTWFSLQQEDYELAMTQCISIDRRFKDRDAQILDLGTICLKNHQYEAARNGFSYLNKKGKNSLFYNESTKWLLKTEYQIAESDLTTNNKIYKSLSVRLDRAIEELGVNRNTLDLVDINAKIKAYHLGQDNLSIDMLHRVLELPFSDNDKAQLKLTLADIYLLQDEVWEATLLYSQVDKALKEEPIGHEARYRNARLRYFIGEFLWAKAQLDVLKAATSKLIANDAMTLLFTIKDNLDADTTGCTLKLLSKADYYIYQNKLSEAMPILDSIVTYHNNAASSPCALLRKAEIIEREGNYHAADSILRNLIDLYPNSYITDDALMRNATICQEHLHDYEHARQCYEQLIDKHPTSIFVPQARKKYRIIQHQ